MLYINSFFHYIYAYLTPFIPSILFILLECAWQIASARSICGIIGFRYNIQSQNHFHHRLYLFFIRTSVTCNGLLNLKRCIFAYRYILVCHRYKQYTSCLCNVNRGLFGLNWRTILLSPPRRVYTYLYTSSSPYISFLNVRQSAFLQVLWLRCIQAFWTCFRHTQPLLFRLLHIRGLYLL